MKLKNRLLLTFHGQPNQFLSGEQLAQQFTVSRTAIWKAVHRLKKEGYPIESVPHLGYRLCNEQDLIAPELIQTYLKKKGQSFAIQYDKVVTSTNNLAKEYISSGSKQPKLFIADEQTAGRGRIGRQFHSPAQTGLYVSFCYFPNQTFQDLTLMTSITAVAVYRAIKAVANTTLQIKWVNDLFLDGKKVAGILTEVVTDLESRHVAGLVVGVGINISKPKTMPSSLHPMFGSLCDDRQPTFTRNQLVAEMLNEWITIVEQLPNRDFLIDYRQQSLVLNNAVTVHQAQTSYEARAVSIDDDGCLIVEKTDGSRQTLSYGEISVRSTLPF